MKGVELLEAATRKEKRNVDSDALGKDLDRHDAKHPDWAPEVSLKAARALIVELRADNKRLRADLAHAVSCPHTHTTELNLDRGYEGTSTGPCLECKRMKDELAKTP